MAFSQYRLVRAKALDQRQHDLVHHVAKRRPAAGGRRRRAPDLANGEPLGRGFGAQPQIDGEPGRFVVPDVLLEAVRREASRAPELGAERLVETDGVQRTHQRPHELRDEDAVARMTTIPRREELDIRSRDRRNQLGDALRGRGWSARIDDDEHLGLRQLRRSEDRAQCRVLPRQSVIRREDAMQRAQRMRRLHAIGFGERRACESDPACRRSIRRRS